MTREARSVRCPESVLGWIPWYAESGEAGEGVLSDRQRGAVEAHAAECADCRAELDMIAGAPFEIDVELPDPDRVFEQITARIDAGEAAEAGAEPATPVIPIGRGRRLDEEDYGRIARWIMEESDESDSPGRARQDSDPGTVVQGPWARSTAWAAAAAVALLFLGGLGGAFLADRSGDSRSAVVYDLATAEAPTGLSGQAGQAAPQIDVVFVDSASMLEISDALREIGVEIVSGPSSMGVYRLRVNVAAGPAGVASDSDTPAIAARLKSGESPLVIFAEPVR